VKREPVFEFAQKPTVARAGDKVTIAFETKGLCDVTVAIERGDGKIIRHLACGVLGPKAPPPLLKDAKKQVLVWDGKDDQDAYVDDKAACSVRVSLGLKPQFERTLFWSPKKRIGFAYPALCAAEEGVYVYEGSGVDHVRLFDHAGNYLRTIYPFPAEKIPQVLGLKTHTFPQDGQALPIKRGFLQSTLLTTGPNGVDGGTYGDGTGFALECLAAGGGKVAAIQRCVNRLAADGSSGGLPFERPQSVCFGPKECTYKPRSAAFSPDGKWLYLAGYHHHAAWSDRTEWMNGVFRIPYASAADTSAPALFVGEDTTKGIAAGGTADGKFRGCTAVACDTQGRVYAADYMNDRLQVFDPDGKFLKAIPVAKPALVAVHPKSGDIFVVSWMLVNKLFLKQEDKVEATFTHLGPFDNPAVKAKCPAAIPVGDNNSCWNWSAGLQGRVTLDLFGEKPTLWVVNGASGSINRSDDGSFRDMSSSWDTACINLFEESDGKLAPKRQFGPEVTKAVARLAPPILWRQRLVVNPATGKLYVMEGDSGVMKSVNQAVEVTPDSGKCKLVELPMGAEDMCFDVNGLAYLRGDTMVVRYDPVSWREVPWDYGEERKGFSFGMGARGADVLSGLVTPGHRSYCFWQLGGLDVSLRGHLAVTTCTYPIPGGGPAASSFKPGEVHFDYEGKGYEPGLYPGRLRWGEIHIWDKHGKMIREDAVPGQGHFNGLGIDQEDNIYLFTPSGRIYDDKPRDPALVAGGTVFKVPAGRSKSLSTGGIGAVPVPLAPESQPKRRPDLGGNLGGIHGWVEGAEWFYGGIGYCATSECICWNSRFTKDYFNRSFAPETMHYSVAVLDSAGNLILRVGKYGNVDDGKPLVAEGPSAGSGQGGPPSPKSIGGDEVGLFYACYVATHTDKRLFIADAGNARISGVRLGYHAEERVALKDVAEQKK
jgi:DNA-binding beta-propeller fold protein YncE